VGVGNSGADIALEASRNQHPTWLAGRESGAVPFDIESKFARNVLMLAVRFVGHHVLSVDTPVGRRARSAMLHRAAPLVRVRPVVLERAGVVRAPRVVGVRDGRPVLADGSSPDVTTIVWCTGYSPDFSWVKLPVFDDDGLPRHASGVVTESPGLFFVGLHFLHAMSSATLVGVSRDAARVVLAIARRPQVGRPSAKARRFWPRTRPQAEAGTANSR
jgi:putative flavoprotein involved in K+ transport